MAKAVAKEERPSTPVGLLPLISYRYDMRRAVRPVSNGDVYWDEMNARYRLWKPLWGIAKFVDDTGRACVGECGVLVSSMHDFCGGIMASSAFAVVRQVPDAQWGGQWRNNPYGQGETLTQEMLIVSGHAGYPLVQHLLPDLSVYTGKERHTHEEAKEVLRRSVAGALVTYASTVARRGVFAADRYTSARTRDIFRLAPSLPYVYHRLPAITAWPGQTDYEADVGRDIRRRSIRYHPWQFRVVGQRTTYAEGSRYRNPNSGSDVGMFWLLAGQTGGLPRGVAMSELPSAEILKYQNPEFLDMCPQVIFHNG